MSVAVHLGFAKAARGRQMAEVGDDRPHLVITQDALGPRHPRWADAVIDDPFQLPVGILLHVLRGERWDRRRHAVGEWDSGVLSIEPVTGRAVVRKRFLPVSNSLRGGGNGVLLILVSDEHMVFRAP